MTINNRVVWSEGLFLRPQHFQQQDRFVERYIELRSAALRAHAWGFGALELDRDLLATGKIALRAAKGVFPDGTPFAMPDDDPVPPAIDVPEDARDQTVYLALPLRRAGAVEISRGKDDADPTRLKLAEIEVRDNSGLTDAQALLEVAGVQARLMLEGENREAYACIPTARIVECRADRQVVLDDQFIPTVTRSATAPRLAGFLRELNGLLHQRGEALGGRAAATGRGASAEIADYLMLQAVNRYEPVAAHLQASGHVHPEDLYLFAAALAGELATYTLSNKRPQPLDPYQHDDLRATFDPLMNAVRRVLSAVLEQTAVPIPLEEKRFGIRVGVVGDRSLFGTAVFVLAAKANLPAETLRASFVRQAKVGPVERIAELVNHQLPGIVLKPMPSPPRQVPYHAGFQYFELDQNGDLFRQLPTSGAIALHLAQVGDEFSGLELELWAIRG
jgi:type VI secretion system protein ImpJ